MRVECSLIPWHTAQLAATVPCIWFIITIFVKLQLEKACLHMINVPGMPQEAQREQCGGPGKGLMNWKVATGSPFRYTASTGQGEMGEGPGQAMAWPIH